MGIQQMLMAGSSGNKTLSQIITDLGLTTNLKLCLDAGDANSYDPAVQTAKWLDTSGGGYDFYRGSSSGGDAGEPTFNGSAGGLSSAEYWSFDGGDFFVYDAANEAWMNACHKDSAVYSFFYVWYPVNFSSIYPIFCTGNTAGAPGFNHQSSSATGTIRHRVQASGGGNVLTAISTGAFNANAWNVGGMSVDEAAATGVHLVNATTNTFTSTYASPSATDPADSMRIGGYAAALGSVVPANTRIACLAIWQGTALSSANLTALYDAIKGRFGL